MFRNKYSIEDFNQKNNSKKSQNDEILNYLNKEIKDREMYNKKLNEYNTELAKLEKEKEKLRKIKEEYENINISLQK